jgi:hypothetical protein
MPAARLGLARSTRDLLISSPQLPRRRASAHLATHGPTQRRRMGVSLTILRGLEGFARELIRARTCEGRGHVRSIAGSSSVANQSSPRTRSARLSSGGTSMAKAYWHRQSFNVTYTTIYAYLAAVSVRMSVSLDCAPRPDDVQHQREPQKPRQGCQRTVVDSSRTPAPDPPPPRDTEACLSLHWCHFCTTLPTSLIDCAMVCRNDLSDA